MLTSIKIKPFYFFLGALQRSSDQSIFNRFIFWDAKSAHHFFDSISSKNPHNMVFHRNKKLSLTGVSLPTRSSTKLIVYPPRIMSFGTLNKKPSQIFYFF